MAEVVRVLPANSLLHRRKEYSEEDCGGRQQEWRLTRQLRRVPIKLLHKMSKEQILKEFPPNGFKLVEEFDKLPWQHLMFFQRDDAWEKRRGGERETGSGGFKQTP